VALTCVLNNLNRSMGLQDPYPFVLPAPALDKLRFVHEIVTGFAPQEMGVPAFAAPKAAPQVTSRN
jgi:hypothetical protein